MLITTLEVQRPFHRDEGDKGEERRFILWVDSGSCLLVSQPEPRPVWMDTQQTVTTEPCEKMGTVCLKMVAPREHLLPQSLLYTKHIPETLTATMCPSVSSSSCPRPRRSAPQLIVGPPHVPGVLASVLSALFLLISRSKEKVPSYPLPPHSRAALSLTLRAAIGRPASGF